MLGLRLPLVFVLYLLLISQCKLSNAFSPSGCFGGSTTFIRRNQRGLFGRLHRAAASGHNEDEQTGTNNNPSTEGPPIGSSKRRSNKDGVGGYDPGEKLRQEELNVGDPQIKLKEKERSVTSILKELAAIQQQGPQKYCILGTRHCSFLHQQIIELL
jgi:hypothetical protein